jgi:hypothetical protein
MRASSIIALIFILLVILWVTGGGALFCLW